MVIPEEREGRMENDPELERGATAANATVNTRQGGVSTSGAATVPQKVGSSVACSPFASIHRFMCNKMH